MAPALRAEARRELLLQLLVLRTRDPPLGRSTCGRRFAACARAVHALLALLHHRCSEGRLLRRLGGGRDLARSRKLRVALLVLRCPHDVLALDQT